MDYNLYYNNTTFNLIGNLGQDSYSAHDVVQDPQFTEIGSSDYTLLTSSPAINAGTDLTASGVTTDILGRARPNAGAFDIGAYEDPNLYVAGDTGLDTNIGSISTPWQTIQKAADSVTPGDIVNVKGILPIQI
jgi:hypothetical protein